MNGHRLRKQVQNPAYRPSGILFLVRFILLALFLLLLVTARPVLNSAPEYQSGWP
jgi:hypothetical protein